MNSGCYGHGINKSSPPSPCSSHLPDGGGTSPVDATGGVVHLYQTLHYYYLHRTSFSSSSSSSSYHWYYCD
ncbi:hypothetical protein E2C01_089091 [Portunus trituberculatus]|uniref:Uncharacterized protein n=1 Tax=Portunus trituberculatus TaxID=210409 RepID=A0A5B7JHU3_PORTR|nr:hypothetical protein [Portunus trituberculatus]